MYYSYVISCSLVPHSSPHCPRVSCTQHTIKYFSTNKLQLIYLKMIGWALCQGCIESDDWLFCALVQQERMKRKPSSPVNLPLHIHPIFNSACVCTWMGGGGGGGPGLVLESSPETLIMIYHWMKIIIGKINCYCICSSIIVVNSQSLLTTSLSTCTCVWSTFPF